MYMEAAMSTPACKKSSMDCWSKLKSKWDSHPAVLKAAISFLKPKRTSVPPGQMWSTSLMTSIKILLWLKRFYGTHSTQWVNWCLQFTQWNLLSIVRSIEQVSSLTSPRLYPWDLMPTSWMQLWEMLATTEKTLTRQSSLTYSSTEVHVWRLKKSNNTNSTLAK